MTIGVQKVWFWLIMPFFVIATSIHCLSNLVGSVGEFRASGTPTASTAANDLALIHISEPTTTY